MSTIIKENYSINIKYMIDECLGINYTEKTYDPNVTIPRLDIGFSTLKTILSGKGKKTKSGKVVSERTIQKIANAFSQLLVHPEERKIYPEDLDLEPETFKNLFPASSFIQKLNSHTSINMMIFTNKLYRCYYMMPNSPHKAYMAYFKLIEEQGQYKAFLVRGIQDFSLTPEIQHYFETPEQLEKCIKQINGGKETESIHLYKASNDASRGHRREEITFTRNCIKIDFHSVEDDPCYSTMFWNICIPIGMQLTTYIGGSALIVDTNDGKRGKNICSFKMGLEAIEDIPPTQHTIITKGPLVSDAPQLIKELVLESSNGLMALDNSDDNRWYRFIQGDNYREKVYDRYADIDINELISSLSSIKADYQRELDELRRYIKIIKKDERDYYR